MSDIGSDENARRPTEFDDNDDDMIPLTKSVWKYTCLRNIKSVVEACGGNAESIQDVLVVRPEYTWLIDTIETGYLQTTHAIVVTGQPGIGSCSRSVCASECTNMLAGKTVFLIYLLLYRLQRMLPTAIQLSNDNYVLFDADGATIYDPRAWWYPDQQYWALADSNEELIIPCVAIQNSGARVIQACPPKPQTWKEWIKQNLGDVVVSDLPTPLEIGAIS